ncbi:hypothetical protein BDV18DRAFT_157266 [Aspergillus unguis]
MRSGLQKPSLVPLLALLIFSLLSFVPTLAKEWNWDVYKYGVNFAYLGRGLPRYDGLYSSRVKNASIDTLTRSRSHSRLVKTDNSCKSWLFGDFYSSCYDSNNQPHHSSSNVPPRSSFEVGSGSGTNVELYPAYVRDPNTVSATKEPSSITRGVSAFKEFVIKRWDEQQIQTQTQTRTQPLSPRHAHAADDVETQPTPTSANVYATLASARGRETGGRTTQADESAEHSAELSFLRLPLFIHETWQQACQRVGSQFESLRNRFPTFYNHTIIPKLATPALFDYERAHPTNLRTQQSQNLTSEHTFADEVSRNSTEVNHSNQTHLRNSQDSTLSNHSLVTAGQSKYIGFRRDSEHMCESSMAIVIALVVGIIWF